MQANSSENKLSITNGIEKLHLTAQESIQLELKLNVSPYGREWLTLGDALYSYGTTKNKNFMFVNNQQFDYLKDLHTKDDNIQSE